MIAHGVMLLADWFKDEKYGVVALMATLPEVQSLSPDNLPDLQIYDEERTAELQTREGPSRLPAILLFSDSDAGIGDLSKPADIVGEYQVMVIYVGRMDADALEERKYGRWVMRAVRRSVRKLHSNKFRAERKFGEMDRIKITDVIEITEQRVTGTVGKIQISRAMIVTLRLMDMDP